MSGRALDSCFRGVGCHSRYQVLATHYWSCSSAVSPGLCDQRPYVPSPSHTERRDGDRQGDRESEEDSLEPEEDRAESGEARHADPESASPPGEPEEDPRES